MKVETVHEKNRLIRRTIWNHRNLQQQKLQTFYCCWMFSISIPFDSTLFIHCIANQTTENIFISFLLPSIQLSMFIERSSRGETQSVPFPHHRKHIEKKKICINSIQLSLVVSKYMMFNPHLPTADKKNSHLLMGPGQPASSNSNY